MTDEPTYEIRNARVLNAEGTAIECEVMLGGQWRAFTATNDDVEQHGRDIFAFASLLDDLTPYNAETEAEREAAQRSYMECSRLQFAMQAMNDGHITEAEAEAWVGTGALPQLALDAIALLPAEDQAAARLRFIGADRINRTSPFVDLLRQVAGLTDAEFDVFYGQAMQL